MSYDYCQDAQAVGASWTYNWGNTFNCPGVENVPMAWNQVPQAISGSSEWLMGFNEPDITSQANLMPEQAAAMWRTMEQRYPSRKLLAPAPSQEHPEWIVEFRNAYLSQYGTPPRLDALAMHFYGRASDAQTLLEWYKARASEWDIDEIWITEFAYLPCWDGIAGSVNQMQQFIKLFESDPMVTRYSWFEARYKGDEPWAFGSQCNTSLVDWNTGQLTGLGRMYK